MRRNAPALLLRDVLSYSAAEAASILDKSPAAVESSLARARTALQRRSAQEPTGHADTYDADLLDAYVTAWERRDIDGIVALLAHDARLAMPPFAEWWSGRDSIEVMLRAALRDCPVAVARRTNANGLPAIAWYLYDPTKRCFIATSIELVTLDAGRVVASTTFVDADMVALFGLPPRIGQDDVSFLP